MSTSCSYRTKNHPHPLSHPHPHTTPYTIHHRCSPYLLAAQIHDNYNVMLEVTLGSDIRDSCWYPTLLTTISHTPYSLIAHPYHTHTAPHHTSPHTTLAVQINDNPNILSGVTLGSDIRDSCWYPPVALEQSIDFIKNSIAALEESDNVNNAQCANTHDKPIAGLIGQ